MTFEEFISNSTDRAFAKSLISHFCGVDLTTVISHPETTINPDYLQNLLDFEIKHREGYPLAYMVGERFFYKNNFKVTEGVLIPQPDTEILVEEAIKTAKKNVSSKHLKILDMCAGSGCIGLSAAKELASDFNDISLVLSDISPVAFSCFNENRKNLLKERNISFSVLRETSLNR